MEDIRLEPRRGGDVLYVVGQAEVEADEVVRLPHEKLGEASGGVGYVKARARYAYM